MDNDGGSIYIRTPRVYVFKSYYPFHDLYHQVLIKLANQLKFEKIQIYANNKDSLDNNRDFQKINGEADLDIIRSTLKGDLDRLIQEVKVPQNLDPITFEFYSQNYYFDIPEYSMLSFLDGKYCCARLLPLLNTDNFFFILMNILQERSVIFLSEKLENISIAM